MGQRQSQGTRRASTGHCASFGERFRSKECIGWLARKRLASDPRNVAPSGKNRRLAESLLYSEAHPRTRVNRNRQISFLFDSGKCEWFGPAGFFSGVVRYIDL